MTIVSVDDFQREVDCRLRRVRIIRFATMALCFGIIATASEGAHLMISGPLARKTQLTRT